MLVLGIETSCDETGVALYDTKRGLLGNALHHRAFPSTFVNVVWAMIALWGLRLTAKRTAVAG